MTCAWCKIRRAYRNHTTCSRCRAIPWEHRHPAPVLTQDYHHHPLENP